MHAPDHATFEIAGAKPRLRDGLVFTLRQTGGAPGAIIEDELRGRFFRVGMAEYTFLSLLDGRTTIGEALGATALRLKDRALTEDEAASLCRWMIESGLAIMGNESAATQEQAREKQSQLALTRWMNPLMLRMPLFCPERWLRAILPLFEWLISGTGAILWTLLCGGALLRIVPEWDGLRQSMRPILDSDNWAMLGMTWLVMKLVHESAHGLTCQKFGGVVRECGVNWLLFVPLPYVDVTSCWRLASTSQRLLVSAAGMLAEIALAAVAALVWTLTDSVVIRQHATNVMISATVTTILFNANPLMRSDGYYLLSDLLDCPNLSSMGRQFVQNLWRVVFLGLKARPLDVSWGRLLLIASYGILASVWSLLVGFGMVIGAANLWRGIGVLLAFVLVVMWYAWPLARGLKSCVVGSESESPHRLRCIAVLCLCLSLLGLTAIKVPAPTVVSAPAVVQSRPLIKVHSLAAARVERLAVQTGDEVQAGDLLIELRNDDLASELAQLRIEIRASMQREIRYLNKAEIAAAAVEQSNRKSHAQHEAELLRMIEGLTVRAPMAGRVVTRQLQELLGQEIPSGTELLTIASTAQPTLIALVPQSEAESIRGREGQPVKGWLWGHSDWVAGRILSIEPRATQVAPHPALTAEAGGPLPVVARDPREAAESVATQSQWMLMEPQLEVVIQLDPETVALALGETGIVRLPIRGGSLAGYLRQKGEQWCSARWTVMHGL